MCRHHTCKLTLIIFFCIDHTVFYFITSLVVGIRDFFEFFNITNKMIVLVANYVHTSISRNFWVEMYVDFKSFLFAEKFPFREIVPFMLTSVNENGRQRF